MTHTETETWIPEVTFGTRLVMVRRRMEWNIKEAAARTGLDDGSWSNWERGAMPRDLAFVADRIVEATGCDWEWLVRGSSGRLADERSGIAVEPALAA